jgi:outer membrane biosynthesis protein TonB
MRTLLIAVPLLLSALTAGACATASAKSKEADRPDLAVPPPPPHVVPITPEPVLEPVADMPATPSAAPAAKPPRNPREAAPRPAATEAKADPKPEPAPPPDPAPVPVVPPAPAPQLRTTDSNAAEGGIRASIDRTRGLLSNIDYRRLTSARKRAYDDAKRFVQQAEDALKDGNAVFAQGVAGKAEILAKELAGK